MAGSVLPHMACKLIWAYGSWGLVMMGCCSVSGVAVFVSGGFWSSRSNSSSELKERNNLCICVGG